MDNTRPVVEEELFRELLVVVLVEVGHGHRITQLHRQDSHDLALEQDCVNEGKLHEQEQMLVPERRQA